jgi:hypothetical protein
MRGAILSGVLCNKTSCVYSLSPGLDRLCQWCASPTAEQLANLKPGIPRVLRGRCYWVPSLREHFDYLRAGSSRTVLVVPMARNFSTPARWDTLESICISAFRIHPCTQPSHRFPHFHLLRGLETYLFMIEAGALNETKHMAAHTKKSYVCMCVAGHSRKSGH